MKSKFYTEEYCYEYLGCVDLKVAHGQQLVNFKRKLIE